MSARNPAEDAPLPDDLCARAEHHLPLVAALAHRFPGCGPSREDLFQQGCVGLMKALARYDPKMGTAFSTYAAPVILGEMRMLCRRDTPLHVPRGERERHLRLRRVQADLAVRLGREPTIHEIADELQMPPEDLILDMETVTVTSCDTDGRDLLEAVPDHDPWEDRMLLRDLISRLPERDRRLLLLRFRAGLTQAETAARMGMTQVQVSRAEAALRVRLRQAWQDADT